MKTAIIGMSNGRNFKMKPLCYYWKGADKFFLSLAYCLQMLFFLLFLITNNMRWFFNCLIWILTTPTIMWIWMNKNKKRSKFTC